jgi:aminoglycoside 3-N-acetyltransferase
MASGEGSVQAATKKVVEINKDRLVTDLRTLGVRPGDLLNIKISLKSIGRVVGGAETVIAALLETLGPDGTIVSDSFINLYPLPLSKENAAKVSDRWTPSYAGAIANAMIKYPNSARSLHPIQKFVAIGGRAQELMEAHTAESYAYDVLRVMAGIGGRNLKIGTDEKVVGVGTTHVAIGLMGFKQKRKRMGINYRTPSGEVATFERNWSGGCGVGFNNFIPLYRERGAIISEGKVGLADSKITDMAKTLAIELEVLAKDPTFFFCNDPTCADCRFRWDFSTGSAVGVAYHRLKKRLGGYIGARRSS